MTSATELQHSGEHESVGSLVASIQRHWVVVLVSGVLFAVAGAVAGYERSPEYKAVSELSVGEASLSTQALQGYSAAAQNLAGVYSRLASSSVVVDQAAKTARVEGRDLLARTSASPIPESSVFRISVSADSEGEAIRQNRALTSTAVAFIARLSDGGAKDRADARAGILRASRRASLKRLESRRLSAKKGKIAVIADLNAQADRFEQDANVWSLRYQQASTATGTDFKGAEVLSPAASAADDRSSWMQKIGLVGAAAGLLVGIALAAALDRRRRRRDAR